MVMTDGRDEIYRDLHSGQLVTQEKANAYSAERILDIVFSFQLPTSLLDVGCGLGTWLKVARSRGVKDIYGVEGTWLDFANLQVDPACIQTFDLEQGFDLGRRFDLVISLEVAEHLSENAAERFIATLVRHGQRVLFSAAIPHQGGHHHVNERFLSYWADLFARFGYRSLNVIRGKIWEDQNVLWWLRQNVVMFVDEKLIVTDDRLRHVAEVSADYPLSVVHPEVYLGRVQQFQQANSLREFLGQGGMFKVAVDVRGNMDITKI